MSATQEDVSTEEATHPVFEFEGDEINEFSAQIPGMKLEAPTGYPRGTILDLRFQVRVRHVRHDEGRGGALVRNHILAIEECEIVGVMTPAQRAVLLAQLQAQEAAEAARAKVAGTAPIIEEEPGGDALDASVDPDDPEGWAKLTDEQKDAARRQAVESGVDEFEAHEPHPSDAPVQAPGSDAVDVGLEVGVADEEPGDRELAAVDPGF